MGEHGTGKTSLVKLAIGGMDKPKGVLYVDIPLECDKEDHVTEAMQVGLGWTPDQVIDDSGKRNYSGSLLANIIRG
jgi:hypothetical protein